MAESGVEAKGGLSVAPTGKIKPDYNVIYWLSTNPGDDRDSLPGSGIVVAELKDGKPADQIVKAEDGARTIEFDQGQKITILWDTGLKFDSCLMTSSSSGRLFHAIDRRTCCAVHGYTSLKQRKVEAEKNLRNTENSIQYKVMACGARARPSQIKSNRRFIELWTSTTRTMLWMPSKRPVIPRT